MHRAQRPPAASPSAAPRVSREEVEAIWRTLDCGTDTMGTPEVTQLLRGMWTQVISDVGVTHVI